MLSLSTKAKMRLQDNQKVYFKADFTLDTSNGRNPSYVGDELKHLSGDDVMSGSATITDATSSSGSFDVGSAIINSLNITLNNFDDRFSLYDFTGATMKVYLGVPLVDFVDDEDDPEQMEWVVKGFYTVDKPTSIGNTIPITMLDNMSKFELLFKDVPNIVYPAKLSQILGEICLHCGVVLGSSVPNPNWTVESAPDDESLTCLDMIGYIAQINGCYARMNNEGYLTFGWYNFDEFGNDSGDNYDGGTFLTSTTPYSDGANLEGGEFDHSSESYIDEDGVPRIKYANPKDEYDGGAFAWGNYAVIQAFSNYSVATEDIQITGLQFKVENLDESAEESEKTYLYDKRGDITDATGFNLAKSTELNPTQNMADVTRFGSLGVNADYCNLEDIPLELIRKYKYIIASVEVMADSFTNISALAVNLNAYYSDGYTHGRKDYSHSPSVGAITEYTKVYAVIPVEDMLVYDNGATITKLRDFDFYGKSIDGDKPTSATNVKYRRYMVELNNSGVPSDYAPYYLLENARNSYNDFMGGNSLRKELASVYALEISDNKLMPLLTDLTTCMNYVARKVVGSTFRPYNISTLSNPQYEAGDMVKIVDNKGNDYNSVITSLSYPLNGYETLNCDAETVNERNSANSNKLSTALASVKNDTNVKLGNYDKAVRNLTELSANALGFYETSSVDELTGSKIEYMHDQPTLEESLNAYKRSMSGFFVGSRDSVDDEFTWKAGVDMEGNAVYKTLTAKGINADWINTGTLKVGGSGSMKDGAIEVYDEADTKVADLNKEGINVYKGTILGSKIGNGSTKDTTSIDITSSAGTRLTFGSNTTWTNGCYIVASDSDADNHDGFGTRRPTGSGDGTFLHWAAVRLWRYSQGKTGWEAVFEDPSDRRLKENIKDFSIDVVRRICKKVSLKFFKFKDDVVEQRTRYGFIAQDIQQIFEEEGLDDRDTVYDRGDGYLKLEYSRLNRLSLPAIGDLYRIVESQQEQIDALKKEIEQLKN